MGGGIFWAAAFGTVDDSSAALHAIVRIGNPVQGVAGSTGPNGGQGLGGVYVASGATVTADSLPVMTANHASTSNQEVFGTIDGGP
jgi:hypothetical protein